MSNATTSARPVRIAASRSRALRLLGFPEALARMAGVRTADVRSSLGFRAACTAAAAGTDAGAAAGPIRVRAVVEGRRTVGHAIADEDAARRLAAACLRRRTVEGLLEGPLSPKVARLAGIRSPARRRWSPDPAVDALAQSALDDVHRWFGVRCVAAPPGAAWVSAFVVPRLLARLPEPDLGPNPWSSYPPHEEGAFEPGCGADPCQDVAPTVPREPFQIVLEDAPEPRVDLPEAAASAEDGLVWRHHPRPWMRTAYARGASALVLLAGDVTRSFVLDDLEDSDRVAATVEAEDAWVRRRVDAAVASLPDAAAPGVPPGDLRVETGFGDGVAASMLAAAGHDDLPPRLGARLAAALPFQLSRRGSATAAVFRSTLPEDLASIAGLVGGQFDGSSGALAFLRLYEGFDARDRGRVLETLRLMPALALFHDDPATLDAVRRGRPLAEVLQVALGRGLHRKTVRSLRGVQGNANRRRQERDGIGTVLADVDAYFASDPHLPALDPRQMAAARQLSFFVTAFMDGAARALRDRIAPAVFRAHRDARGRLREPTPGERDLLRWLRDRCKVAYSRQRRRRGHDAGMAHHWQACAILYPHQRRHEAVTRLDAEWHRDVVRLTFEHDSLVAELRGRGGKAKAGPAPVFPHLAAGPVEIDGVVLAPLVGPETIAAEGRDLGHCIGTYAGRASVGSCMLLGLTSADGRSSAEVVAAMDRDRKTARLWIRQHYGPRNGTPPAAHVAALDRWVAAQAPRAVLAMARVAERAGDRDDHYWDPYHGIGHAGRERIAALCRAQLAPYLSGEMKSLPPERWSLP